MKAKVKNAVKAGVILGLSAFVLVGCGSSSEEDQLAWIYSWNKSIDFEAKMKMLNSCFKEAGVKSKTKLMTDAQVAIMDECELDYIIALAETEGVNLDRELLDANTI
ncbi:hypothetical protein [Shewanella ulleungensis]|uniref:hypothetical protein n=1 Tax=Shewanella ulleungensis TaxID=2282699 RepID=UPI003D7B6C52